MRLGGAQGACPGRASSPPASPAGTLAGLRVLASPEIFKNFTYLSSHTRTTHDNSHTYTHFLRAKTVAMGLFSQKFPENFSKTFDSYNVQ